MLSRTKRQLSEKDNTFTTPYPGRLHIMKYRNKFSIGGFKMQLIFTTFGHFTPSKWQLTLSHLVILFPQTYNTNITNVHDL